MQHNVSLPAWSDAPELVKDGVLHVSIHVPAWGATHRQSWLPVLGNVSIHAPAWGATQRAQCGHAIWHVSIHAPAWGATIIISNLTIACLFQSTLPRGERQCVGKFLYVLNVFQSTLPRGERLAILRSSTNGTVVSIHAPAWGATRDKELCGHANDRFNPRSRVGSDRDARSASPCRACFNPRSRVGSDRMHRRRQTKLKMFQSTLPRGERRIVENRVFVRCSFNPRSRVGSDS